MNLITEPVRLALAFKGDRDYLHGTDIFNALIALTGARSAISFQIHKIVRHPLYVVLTVIGTPAPDFNGLFEYVQDERWLSLGLREDTSSAVESRVPYDEAAVGADARISPGHIVSPGPGIATFIERVLALNKLLLNAHFAPARIKWLFTRLELDVVPPNPTSVALTFISNVATRLTKSAIEADRSRIGFVYFSEART